MQTGSNAVDFCGPATAGEAPAYERLELNYCPRCGRLCLVPSRDAATPRSTTPDCPACRDHLQRLTHPHIQPRRRAFLPAARPAGGHP